ncbi:hypothetical protein V6Z11_D12G093200 [Gossypium hirsutum]
MELKLWFQNFSRFCTPSPPASSRGSDGSLDHLFGAKN